MKIRNGFVSNSSSSSFVVAFNKEPKTIEDVKKQMFGNEEEILHPYDDCRFPTERIAETVFDDIKKQKVNNKTKIFEAIANGWFDGRPEYDYLSSYPQDKDPKKIREFELKEEEYEKQCQEAAEKFVNKFIEDNKGKFIYTFHYGDNDGSYYCLLEHGEIFSKLNHIQTSYH